MRRFSKCGEYTVIGSTDLISLKKVLASRGVRYFSLVAQRIVLGNAGSCFIRDLLLKLVVAFNVYLHFCTWVDKGGTLYKHRQKVKYSKTGLIRICCSCEFDDRSSVLDNPHIPDPLSARLCRVHGADGCLTVHRAECLPRRHLHRVCRCRTCCTCQVSSELQVLKLKCMISRRVQKESQKGRLEVPVCQDSIFP